MVQQSMLATAVFLTEGKMQERALLVEMAGAQQGLGQGGRPGPTDASHNANAGHASNPSVAANAITLVYNQDLLFFDNIEGKVFNQERQSLESLPA